MKIYRIAYLSIITTFLLLAAFSPVRAQSMSQYTFTPSSGAFRLLNGATVQRPLNDNLDEGYYPLAPIGFNFKFNDVVYTRVSASTNGWMSFGSLAGTGIYENTLTYGLSRPIAAPFWDDLAVSSTNGSVSYLTSGTAPNRWFTMQWINMKWDGSASTAVISFQVILYETTNAVQFVYRQGTGAVNTSRSEFGASIGLAATLTGSGNFLSLSNSGTNPTVSTTTETTNIGTRPAEGQTYTFTPSLAPTAASVSVSGRVLTGNGRGLMNATVTMTDMNGNTRTARTGSRGYFRFNEVEAGQTYVVSVSSKRYSFAPQVISVMEDLTELNFTAQN